MSKHLVISANKGVTQQQPQEQCYPLIPVCVVFLCPNNGIAACYLGFVGDMLILSCYVPSQIIPKSRVVHLADKQI